MNPVLKNNMIIEFKALGKEALAMDQYDLEAVSNKSYSAQDWAEFLQEPDIRDYIKREMRVIRESSINKIIADAGTSHSVGQAQLISALQKVADDDKEADGPVFIYCYVPLNDEQMHAPNVQEVDRFGFPKKLETLPEG